VVVFEERRILLCSGGITGAVYFLNIIDCWLHRIATIFFGGDNVIDEYFCAN
jgi:hypothetical protein